MRQKTISITSARSITVIQGAYETYCIPAECAIEYHSSNLWTAAAFFSAPQQATLTTEPPIDDWLKYQRLAAQWQHERGAMSSITEASLCPSYQAIIGMGPTAVPFICAQLESERDEPDQWFWALGAITGALPVKEEDRGNFVRMAETWLQWAKSEGYAW